MKSFSRGIGLEKVMLAEDTEIADDGKPIGKKITPTIVRQDLYNLEQTYISDPVVFNSINKIVQIIMAAGYHLEGSEKSVKFFETFFGEIGLKGGDLTEKELWEQIFKQECIYGRSMIEKIYNNVETKIVDIDVLDTKRMDYVKRNDESIMLDKYNRPLGYTMSLGVNALIAEQPIQPPQDADVPTTSLYLPADIVAQFKLYTFGDGFYPIGLIESIFQGSLRKLTMEEALANAVYKTGFPIKYAKIGDMTHEPTRDQIAKIVKQMSTTNYKTVLGLPYWVELGMLEAKNPEKLQEHLDYFIDQEVTGLGIAKAFATGAGEETNRATLARQEYLMKLTMKEIIDKTVQSFRKQIMAPMAEQYKLPDVPFIRWGEIALEEIDAQAERLKKYADAGLITPDEDLEKYIRKLEELPDKGKVLPRQSEPQKDEPEESEEPEDTSDDEEGDDSE